MRTRTRRTKKSETSSQKTIKGFVVVYNNTFAKHSNEFVKKNSSIVSLLIEDGYLDLWFSFSRYPEASHIEIWDIDQAKLRHIVLCVDCSNLNYKEEPKEIVSVDNFADHIAAKVNQQHYIDLLNLKRSGFTFGVRKTYDQYTHLRVY